MAASGVWLGPQETKLLFSLEKKEISVFTAGDAKEILGTGQAACSVLSGLHRKGRVRRISRGKYMLVPAHAGPDGHWSEYYGAVVPALADEYYVGFATAMKFWDMTEQITRTVFVATPKRKKNPVVEFAHSRYQFVTLAKKRFFGIVKAPGSYKFNISSVEKTIVDGLTYPRYCGGMPEVAKAMWNGGRGLGSGL